MMLTEVYDPALAPVAQEGEDFDIAFAPDGEAAAEPSVDYAAAAYLDDPFHGVETGVRGVVKRLMGLTPLTVPENPAARGWGQAGEHQRANCCKVTARGISVTMNEGVAVIFGHLMVDLDDHLKSRGKTRLAGKADDWGLAIRMVRGSRTKWSNHAWGLAADFNAIENPMTSNLVTTFDPKWVRNLLKTKYKGLIRWGGDYSSRKDAMHFEFMGTPAQARMLTTSLRADNKVKPAPTPVVNDPAHQHEKPTIKINDKGHGDAVKDLIGHLNAAYRPYRKTIRPLPVGTKFTVAVDIRFRDWQERTGLKVDGTCGPTSWNRIHQVTKNVRLDAAGRRF